MNELARWTRNNKLLAVVCAAMVIAGCGKQPHNTHADESKLTIVGGHAIALDVSDVRRLSTVALTTDVSNSRRPQSRHLLDQGHAFCTATIIAKRALMTAAHCIQDFNPQTNAKSASFILPSSRDFIAFFGTQVASDGQWLRAQKVVPHPEWSPELTLSGDASRPPHDIGLVILEKDIPETYVPAAIADDSVPLRINHPVTLVGYGVTRSRRNNNTGILREVQLPLKSIDTRSQLLGVGNFMKGACAGDSGGPMYAQDDNGHWFVIGVTSAGIEVLQNCIGIDNSYTDARAHRKWIQSTLASNGIELGR